MILPVFFITLATNNVKNFDNFHKYYFVLSKEILKNKKITDLRKSKKEFKKLHYFVFSFIFFVIFCTVRVELFCIYKIFLINWVFKILVSALTDFLNSGHKKELNHFFTYFKMMNLMN